MSAVDEFTNMAEGGFILDSDYEMLQYNALMEIIEGDDVSRRGGSNFLGRMIQDMYEKSAGRMRIYPATWVLEQCKNIIREKGCKYGNTDKLISRDDLDGKRMILVNVRGVHCPDESRAGRFPRVEGGYSIFFSECKVCRNYKPKDRFPICKLRRADNPAAATLNGINDVFKKASDSFNEMMGNHGPEDRGGAL